MLYILITGARDVRDWAKAADLARSLLSGASRPIGVHKVQVIHGNADGMDRMFAAVCEDMGIQHEGWSADLFPNPLIRNEFMVKMVAEFQRQGHQVVCWAFARKWASGTGHCARKARQHGVTVTDYGVDTKDPKDPF